MSLDKENWDRPSLERAFFVQVVSPVAEEGEDAPADGGSLGRQQTRKRVTSSQLQSRRHGPRCAYAFPVCTGGIAHCRNNRRCG